MYNLKKDSQVDNWEPGLCNSEAGGLLSHGRADDWYVFVSSASYRGRFK